MQRRGNENLRSFLLPGFCGGLTTFSAVAGLTLEPQEGGQLFLFHNINVDHVVNAPAKPMAKRA